MRPFVKLYKNGDDVAVQTNCTEDRSFVEEFAITLAALIDRNGDRGYDWQFDLERWFGQGFEVLAKLRGYKADVVEERLITAGRLSPCPGDLIVDSNDPASARNPFDLKTEVGS